MRVLILTKNFPPRSCGVGDYACRMAGAFAAAGDSVSVLTEPSDSPRHCPIGLREHPLRGWRDLQPVLREVAQAAPDRVQLEYSGYAWGRWGTAWWLNVLLFAVRRRGISVHIGLHEGAIRMRQHPLQVPVALAQWAHIGLLLAAAETVAVNMPARMKLLGRVFPWWRAKLRYRPNSSTIPVAPISEAERDAIRREREVSSGDFVVTAFGLFHKAKNYEALIEGVAQLRQQRPVKLWLLGDAAAASPEYITWLRHVAREGGVENAVWWPGRLDAAEISRALQAADVFVLPQPDGHVTRSSAFMAAAAHGLPVIAVRDPANQLEFIHGENVWLMERSTPEGIAAALGALLGDRAAARRMGRKLQQLYEARFDWPVTLARPRELGKSPLTSAARSVTTQGEQAVTAAHAGGAKP